VHAKSRQKVVRIDGNREFFTTLETVSATGQVISPFIVWANTVHCAEFYDSTGDHQRPAIFSCSPSRYLDDDLGLGLDFSGFVRYFP